MVDVVTEVDLAQPVAGIPKPTIAYVLYESGERLSAITEHSVEKGALSSGRLVSMAALARSLESRKPDKGAVVWLPENILLNSSKKLVWYTKARLQRMWFEVQGKRRSYRVWWPNLLWIAEKERGELRIFALGKQNRPGPSSSVYHAPLMNIGGRGTLCEGTASLPDRLDVDTIQAMEDCVFASLFTHVNHDRTLKGMADNRAHLGYWRHKERSGAGVRVKDLVKVGTVEEVVG